MRVGYCLYILLNRVKVGYCFFYSTEQGEGRILFKIRLNKNLGFALLGNLLLDRRYR